MKYVLTVFLFVLFFAAGVFGYLKWQEGVNLQALQSEAVRVAASTNDAQAIYDELQRLSREHHFVLLPKSVKINRQVTPVGVSFVVRSGWLPIQTGGNHHVLVEGGEAASRAVEATSDAAEGNVLPGADRTILPNRLPPSGNVDGIRTDYRCQICAGRGRFTLPGGNYQICRTCGGDGRIEYDPDPEVAAPEKDSSSMPGVRQCVYCRGSGKVRDMREGFLVTCSKCRGTGLDQK